LHAYAHKSDKAALKNAEADNAKLQELLDDAKAVGEVGAANDEDGNATISRPSGTAGSAWSIQVEMGLQGKGKKYDMYKAIQVSNGTNLWIKRLLLLFIAQCPRLGPQCAPQLGGLVA
jgi:hypothetical protein